MIFHELTQISRHILHHTEWLHKWDIIFPLSRWNKSILESSKSSLLRLTFWPDKLYKNNLQIAGTNALSSVLKDGVILNNYFKQNFTVSLNRDTNWKNCAPNHTMIKGLFLNFPYKILRNSDHLTFVHVHVFSIGRIQEQILGLLQRIVRHARVIQGYKLVIIKNTHMEKLLQNSDESHLCVSKNWHSWNQCILIVIHFIETYHFFSFFHPKASWFEGTQFSWCYKA